MEKDAPFKTDKYLHFNGYIYIFKLSMYMMMMHEINRNFY